MSLLSFSNVAKSYGNVAVLRGISLAVNSGEVVALVGENGAGKSTLMRIMAGLIRPSTGLVTLAGSTAPSSVSGAEEAGIVMVHQEFCLAPHISVYENVFLGRELVRGFFVDRRAMEKASPLGVGLPRRPF